MKKYKVYDLYEGKDVVGYADTLNDVKHLARDLSITIIPFYIWCHITSPSISKQRPRITHTAL